MAATATGPFGGQPLIMYPTATGEVGRLAVEIDRVAYKEIPGTDPLRYIWDGIPPPDHIILALPDAGGVAGIWYLRSVQVEHNAPAPEWLAGPGTFEEILLIAWWPRRREE